MFLDTVTSRLLTTYWLFIFLTYIGRRPTTLSKKMSFVLCILNSMGSPSSSRTSAWYKERNWAKSLALNLWSNLRMWTEVFCQRSASVILKRWRIVTSWARCLVLKVPMRFFTSSRHEAVIGWVFQSNSCFLSLLVSSINPPISSELAKFGWFSRFSNISLLVIFLKLRKSWTGVGCHFSPCNLVLLVFILIKTGSLSIFIFPPSPRGISRSSRYPWTFRACRLLTVFGLNWPCAKLLKAVYRIELCIKSGCWEMLVRSMRLLLQAFINVNMLIACYGFVMIIDLPSLFRCEVNILKIDYFIQN